MVELFLIPVAMREEKICFLTQKHKTHAENDTFPTALLKQDMSLRDGIHGILKNILPKSNGELVAAWLNSPRCKDRIVDVYDRNFLFENETIPYPARPLLAKALRYNDYAHLARLQEWGKI